jgi:cytochrome c551
MNVTLNKLKKATITGLAVAGLLAVVLFPIPSAAVGAPAGDGAATFKTKCATCHAVDGSGNTPMGKKLALRDLRSAEVQKQTDAQLSNVIAKGKGKMPPFGKSLSGDQIPELVAHVRTLRK